MIELNKFKNIFAKGYTPNWSREIFIVDKINDTVANTYNLKDLNTKKLLVVFMIENYKRLNYKNQLSIFSTTWKY